MFLEIRIIFTSVIALVASVSGDSLDPVADASTLKSVQIVFRHGQKMKDVNLGERTGLLKDEGKLQMFEVGEYTRHRYGDFISVNYDPNEVQIITSGAKRCTQSGTMFAYGLYQNFSRAAKWNPGELQGFEPIPVEPIPAEFDKWIQRTAPCPRKKALEDELMKSIFEDDLSKNRDFYQAYAEATGDHEIFNESSTKSLAQRMFAPLSVFDPSVPKPPGNWHKRWLDGQNLYFELKYIYNDRYYAVPGDLGQIATGPFFEMLYNRTELSRSPSKLYAYATHDFSITALTILFGQNLRDFAPDHPTGTTYFLEVHQAPNDTNAAEYLQVFYRNSTSEPIRQFEVRECGSPCYVSKFKKLVQKWVPQDYEEMCGLVLGSGPFKNQVGWISVLIWFGAGFVVAGLAIRIIAWKCRSRHEYQEAQVSFCTCTC